MQYMFYSVLLIFIVGLDQISKYLISINLDLFQEISVIPGFFSLYHTRNTGMAFSMFQGKMILFYLATFIAIVLFTYMLIKEKSKFNKACFLFIIGGAIGNLIDRIRFQYVIDFISLNFFGYKFAVFNIADSFLTVGCIMLILKIIFNKNAKN